MTAPSIVRVYPADGDTGIPVGQTLEVYFDRGVDLKTVSDSIVLFGSDFDQTSGPDNAIWIDKDTGNNKFFLSSPGFKGYVPVKIELAYWDTTDTVNYAEVSSPVSVTGESVETSNSYGHKVKITLDPKHSATLAADTEYKLFINGDPDSTDTGVSSRTVFDVVTGTSVGAGELYVYGTYTGEFSDTLNVEVTADGNIGTAQYKWWWTSAGSGSATTKRVTNRRFRKVDEGLQIRFKGSDLRVGDSWSINVEPVERMLTSTNVTFNTNDGSYTTAPESPSTPATSEPPSSVLPGYSSGLDIDYMIPANSSYNVDIENRIITIVFTEDIDPATVTDSSITLYKYPAEGYYDSTFEPTKLQKSLEVSGNTITIRF